MAEITAALVKQLRDATSVSMMECKRALTSCDGDLDQAMKLLREQGVTKATKRAERATNQGLISSSSTEDGKIASLVELNCETDFVARNDMFKAMSEEMAVKACATDGNLAEEAKDEVTNLITSITENIVLSRNTRMQLEGTGKIESYIHLGQKVGVLVEIGCEKAETVENDSFKELCKDVALHVAASAPQHLKSDEVPEDVIASEREIFAKQAEGKPAEIIDKIVDGKIKKFFGEICLIDQPFVKEPKQSITELVEAKGKDVGDTLSIKRFVRYQLGQ